MPDPDPRTFIAEYVEPAIASFKADQTVKHLAAHAIAQVDILAAVLANHQLLKGDPALKPGVETAFRRTLKTRYPVLGEVQDAHDAHKHGRLSIKNAAPPRNFTDGFEPEAKTSYGFFLDHSFLGGPPTPFIEVVLTMLDGTDKRIDLILLQAMDSWRVELERLGL